MKLNNFNTVNILIQLYESMNTSLNKNTAKANAVLKKFCPLLHAHQHS